ncbi:MAG: hypothetical protein HKN72_16955 [Gemmatimonadetes bacterium]|nr:hypothetical protein [Gemmatimonadota bacterium]NNF14920.1 hypothetical protein [Gemmatimonadota bacterium]NNL31447.1 hypothetical protein [Gemmatimonadota bacterium]
MKGRAMVFMASAALAIATAGEAAAQDTTDRRGSRMTSEPERIMALRERLELTEDQLSALEQLRVEGVERRAETRATMDELRSRLRAGEIERDQMRASLEELRQAQPNAGDRRARIEGILTEDQLGSLQEMRTRRSAVRERRGEARGARGQVRGARREVRGARRGARGIRAQARVGRGVERIRQGSVRMRVDLRRAWRGEVARRRAAARAWRR